MAKKETDRHVDVPTVSFTLLVPLPHLTEIKRIAKAEERTKGYVVRTAIEEYLRRKAR